MRGLLKTLFGGARNFFAAAICVVLAVILLHTPAARFTGLALPLMLLGTAAYLSKH